MEMLLGFLVLLACLVIGVRHGGLGLAAVSGVGLIIFTFGFGYQPGKPPIDVMLTIMAVVTCAGFLQTSGGLTVMLKYAEKFLRRNPKYITILAPITTWFLTVLCGTGHVVYTMFPIIYDIAISRESVRSVRWQWHPWHPRWESVLLRYLWQLFRLSALWRQQVIHLRLHRFWR